MLALALAGVYALSAGTTPVSAIPSGPPTVAGGGTGSLTVTASYTDDGAGAGSAILTAIGSGTISSCVLTANSDSQTISIAAGSCTVGTDLDTLAEATTISLVFTCSVPGTVTFYLSEGGTTSTSAVTTCGTSATYNPCTGLALTACGCGAYFNNCCSGLYNTYGGYNNCYNPFPYQDPMLYFNPQPTAPVYTQPAASQPAAPAYTQPAPAQPIYAAPPAAAIRPPSTGDAGLLVLQ